YQEKVSEPVRYAIEVTTVNGDADAYSRLRSPCGPIISLLNSPAHPEMYGRPKEPNLLFEYSYRTLSSDREAQFKPSVVLVHQQTGQRYVLPSEVVCRGFASGGGSGVVLLQNGVRAGRYRVFLDFTEHGKVISTGHYFETDL